MTRHEYTATVDGGMSHPPAPNVGAPRARRMDAWFMLFAVGSLVGCAGGDVGRSITPLTAVCLDEAIPPGVWLCPDQLLAECDNGDGTGSVDEIYARPVQVGCEDVELSVEPGPFAVGAHEIVVYQHRDALPPEPICRASLTVQDSFPPEVESKVVSLWPPNHKLHTITPDDCVEVRDACDPDVDVRFSWVSSDEADDANGDGHTGGDVHVLSPTAIELRAERQGGGDGRVYTIGWIARDAAGNSVEGTCLVEVAHDQSGRGARAGDEAYRISIDS